MPPFTGLLGGAEKSTSKLIVDFSAPPRSPVNGDTIVQLYVDAIKGKMGTVNGGTLLLYCSVKLRINVIFGERDRR